jgi:regulator of protease activity HflC (stomatin/prohibitin superfamily)
MERWVLIFSTIFLVEGLVWLILTAVAYKKKVFVNFYLMLVCFLIWSIMSFTVINSMEPSLVLSGGMIALLIGLVLIPLVLLPGTVSIITEYQRGVLFRFGKLLGVLNPGFNIILPFGIDRVWKVDLRTFTIEVARQEVITRDNVPVMVDAVVYFNVLDAERAVTKVADYTLSTTLLGQTVLRSVLGQHDLDEMLSNRAELNKLLRKLLDDAAEPWGINVTAVEIRSVELPDTMKRAMAKQAEAERERRAKVIAADGEFQASQKLLEAATVIAREPSALQLRYLQTLTEIAVEKNSTIMFPLPIELLKAFGQGSGKEDKN